MSEIKKTIIITGGLGLLGRRASEYFLNKGFHIIIIDVSDHRGMLPKGIDFIKYDLMNIDSYDLLINKIGDNKIKCVKEGLDQYKRILAECFVNNESLSKYLVREGFAFAYRKYSTKFIEDENYAKKNKKGMWAMKFEYPWEYRKRN